MNSRTDSSNELSQSAPRRFRSGEAKPPEEYEIAESDLGTLRSGVEESRHSFEKQLETFDEIDDKAMRTTRTAVIVAGFIVPAVGIIGPDVVADLDTLILLIGGGGLISLIVSATVGVGTYVVSEYPTGIGSEHRADIITKQYTEGEWYTSLLQDYSKWADQVRNELNRNHGYLQFCQMCLLFGIISLLTATLLQSISVILGISVNRSFVLVMLLLLVIMALMRREIARINSQSM